MSYLRVENFLSLHENKQLIDWCVNNQKAFTPSSVTTAESGYRKSLVAYACPLVDLVTEKILTLGEIISNSVEFAIDSISSVESQVTFHGNGDYFKIHTDNNDPRCSRRVLSYVYYFHSLPKMFEGGELAFYTEREKRNRTLITPDNNSLVCFSSGTWHEVLPVVGGTAFDQGRFTVNGWINT